MDGYLSHLILFLIFLLELAYGKGALPSSSSSSSSSSYDNSYSLGLSSSEYEAQHPKIVPKILSRGQSYRAVIGDTITLPCQVEDLGSFMILWYRGGVPLTAANLMVTRDPRFKLIDGYNLQVKDVRPRDAGDYYCQINDQDNRESVHTVEILVPPSVKPNPESGHITVRKGGSVTLECKASGNPVPSISWIKKDRLNENPQIAEGPTISLERVDRQNSGIYQCVADNGVRDPVTANIQLTVLSPPEITVEKSWVHAGEGYEAKLVCVVHGEANPVMTWYQDSFLLEATDRRTMEAKGDRHILTIRNVQTSDYGNYSCVADNSLGRAKKYIEVSGRPGPAEFHSSLYSRSKDSYNLTWSIESIPPLEEIRLLYRKLNMNETYQHPGRWHDIILTPSSRGIGSSFQHTMTYTIKGLENNSVYETIVQAKNRYGWNEVSDIFQFYIQNNHNHQIEEMESLLHSTQNHINSGISSIHARSKKFYILFPLLIIIGLLIKL